MKGARSEGTKELITRILPMGQHTWVGLVQCKVAEFAESPRTRIEAVKGKIWSELEKHKDYLINYGNACSVVVYVYVFICKLE